MSTEKHSKLLDSTSKEEKTAQNRGLLPNTGLSEETGKIVPWVQIRSQIERRNTASLCDSDHALRRYALLPLGDGLRADTRERRQSSKTANVSGGNAERGLLDRLVVADGLVGKNGGVRSHRSSVVPFARRPDGAVLNVHEERKLHQQFTLFNSQFIANATLSPENKPMVDVFPKETLPFKDHVALAGFVNFQDWLNKVLEPRGMQARCSEATGASPQLIGKWRNGSVPKPDKLKILAKWAGADLAQLQLLVHQVEPLRRPEENERWTSTAKGAMVGRAWELLNKHNPSLAEQFSELLQGQLNAFTQEQNAEIAQPRQKQSRRA